MLNKREIIGIVEAFCVFYVFGGLLFSLGSMCLIGWLGFSTLWALPFNVLYLSLVKKLIRKAYEM